MDNDHIRQRDQIMQQFWRVEDADADAASIRAAAQRAVGTLLPLLKDANAQLDDAELGRTWRYLGDCHYAYAGKSDEAALRRARQAYLEGRPRIERGGDLVELAKLDFNLANTSRLIEGGRNPELMQEAKRRYYSALLIFRTHMPQAVPRVESSLQSLEIGLRALEMYEHARQGLEATAALKRKLEQAGPNPSPALLAEVQHALEGTHKADAANQMLEIQSFLDAVGPVVATSAEQQSQWENQRQQFSQMARQWIVDDNESSGSDEHLFDMVFAKLEEAHRGGEVSPARRDALKAILTQFQQLQRQRTSTPEEMVARVGLMRALINRHKGILDRSAKF